MSETTEKIEPVPCGWCRAKPEYVEAWDMWQHPTTDCPEAIGHWFYGPLDWNDRQAAILARRRADFEAGAGLHYNANLTLGRQRIAEQWDAYLEREAKDHLPGDGKKEAE